MLIPCIGKLLHLILLYFLNPIPLLFLPVPDLMMPAFELPFPNLHDPSLSAPGLFELLRRLAF